MKVKVRKITDERVEIMSFQRRFNRNFWLGRRANKRFPLFGDLAYKPNIEDNIYDSDKVKMNKAMECINNLKKAIRANHQRD